jgi:hypothetical protein
LILEDIREFVDVGNGQMINGVNDDKKERAKYRIEEYKIDNINYRGSRKLNGGIK